MAGDGSEVIRKSGVEDLDAVLDRRSPCLGTARP